MGRRIEQDYRNSAVQLLKTSSWLFKLIDGGLRLINRGMMHLESARASRAIDEGLVSGKLEDALLGTLDDLRVLGMLEGPRFHLGYSNGHPVYRSQDRHIAMMGMAGLGKTTSPSAPNILRLLKGDEDGNGQEPTIILDWKNGEIAHMLSRGA